MDRRRRFYFHPHRIHLSHFPSLSSTPSDTGAIFTLGKSHLSDDHQHFFFIRNDPVERLRCGYHESAAICKSGRCFVWGYNQCGQLGIGQICDVVTKPSCIKEIKQQLLKVVDVAFGDGFSVILTNDNRLFTCGKRVIPDSFKCLPNAVEIISKPVAIDDLNEERRYSRIAAAHQQFAAYSKGKKELVICGRTGVNEKSCKVKVLRLWDDISQLACGSTFTLALSKNGLLYAVGKVGERVLPTLLRVDHPQMNFVSVHVTYRDDIYLLTDSGEVFRNEVELHFHKVTLVPNLNEKVVALATGKDGVLSFLTENQRFFTSFITPKTVDSAYDYKELTKFKPMDVKQLAAGNYHILVHAQRNDQKAFYTRNLLTESSVIYPSRTSSMTALPVARQNGTVKEAMNNNNYYNTSSSNNNINNNNNNLNKSINSNTSNVNLSTTNPKSYTKSFEVQEYVDNFLNGNQQMSNWTGGDNPSGEIKRTSPYEGVDGDLIKYIPLKGSPRKTVLNDGVLYRRSPVFPARFQNAFESFESDTNSVVQNEKFERVRREIEKDENLKIVRITDPIGGEIHHSFHHLPVSQANPTPNRGPGNAQSKSMMDIRFIDNGVDVTQSIKRTKAVLDEGMLLGEKLLHPKRYNNKVGCSKEDTMKEIMEQPCVECRKATPFHKQMGVSFEGDDLDDKTTASLSSAPKLPPPGIMKQFLIDLKRVPDEFSCKTDDTIDGGW